MARSVLKVFGERNTGTRAVIRMMHDLPGIALRVTPAPAVPPTPDPELVAAIEAHFCGQWRRQYLHALRDDDVVTRCADDQWKHAAPVLTPGMIAARVHTLFMVRDPYSWAVSLARNAYHRKGPRPEGFETFLDRPWLTEQRDGLASVLRSPLHLWSAKLAAYRAYMAEAAQAGLPVAVLRFEAFVAGPTAALAGALDTLGLNRPVPPPPQSNTKDADTALPQLQEHYANAGWETVLTAGAVATINAHVDWAVATSFGYTRRDPAAYPEARAPEVEATLREEMSALGKRGRPLQAVPVRRVSTEDARTAAGDPGRSEPVSSSAN